MCEATLEVVMVVERLRGPASGVGKHSRGRAEGQRCPGEVNAGSRGFGRQGGGGGGEEGEGREEEKGRECRLTARAKGTS